MKSVLVSGVMNHSIICSWRSKTIVVKYDEAMDIVILAAELHKSGFLIVKFIYRVLVWGEQYIG